MVVPTSEVGYTSAMPRREDHEVRKDMWRHWGGGGYCVTSTSWYFHWKKFSNLPFFVTRRRRLGKCESIYIDNCTRRVRSLKTDILRIRSKYQMNETVAPICCCLLGNRDPATLWNVGNYLPTNKTAHPNIVLIFNLHSLLFSWPQYDTKITFIFSVTSVYNLRE